MKIRKSDDLHRLEEIETKEVSMVDRAANKRKFVIVKREDIDMGPEVITNDDGTLSTNKSSFVLNPEHRDLESISKTIEQLTVELVKKAEISDSAEFPHEITSNINTAVGLLVDEVQKVAKQALISAHHQETHADTVLATGGGNPSLVDERYGPPDADKTNTSKASGQWMQELKGLFETMRSVVEDAKRAPSDAPNSEGPNAGSGVQPDTSVVSDASQIFSGVPGLADLVKSLEGLSKEVKDLRKLKKTVTKQATRIQELECGVGLPASSTPVGVCKAENKVVWPHDMNAKQRDY